MIAKDISGNLIMYQALGRGTASVTASVGLPTIPSGATIAMLQAGAVAVSLTVDGTTPTATVGQLLAINETVYIVGGKDIAAARVYAGSASVIEVTYFG